MKGKTCTMCSHNEQMDNPLYSLCYACWRSVVGEPESARRTPKHPRKRTTKQEAVNG